MWPTDNNNGAAARTEQKISLHTDAKRDVKRDYLPRAKALGNYVTLTLDRSFADSAIPPFQSFHSAVPVQ